MSGTINSLNTRRCNRYEIPFPHTGGIVVFVAWIASGWKIKNAVYSYIIDRLREYVILKRRLIRVRNIVNDNVTTCISQVKNIFCKTFFANWCSGKKELSTRRQIVNDLKHGRSFITRTILSAQYRNGRQIPQNLNPCKRIDAVRKYANLYPRPVDIKSVSPKVGIVRNVSFWSIDFVCDCFNSGLYKLDIWQACHRFYLFEGNSGTYSIVPFWTVDNFYALTLNFYQQRRRHDCFYVNHCFPIAINHDTSSQCLNAICNYNSTLHFQGIYQMWRYLTLHWCTQSLCVHQCLNLLPGSPADLLGKAISGAEKAT